MANPTAPVCCICKNASNSVFLLNYIGKGQVKICPTCNKKRESALNSHVDGLGSQEKSLFKRREFNKLYFDKEIKE